MRKILVYLIVLSLVFASACSMDIFGDCCSCKEASGEATPYSFPPAEEIRSIPGYPEKLKHLQVPEKVLRRMCTFDLVETYFNSPLVNNLIFFNNFKSAFIYLQEDFNGARELANRNDAGRLLLKRYQLVASGNVSREWESLVRVKFQTNLFQTELTLSQDQIMESLSFQEKETLLEEAVKKLHDKEAHRDFYTIRNVFSTSDFLIANTLYGIGYRPFLEYVQSRPAISQYLSGYIEATINDADRIQIREYALTYINALK